MGFAVNEDTCVVLLACCNYWRLGSPLTKNTLMIPYTTANDTVYKLLDRSDDYLK